MLLCLRQLSKHLWSEVTIKAVYKVGALPTQVTIDVHPSHHVFRNMRVFILLIISFAAPILGAPAQDLTEVLQKLPDLLEDLPKLPDEETPWQNVTCDVPSLKSKFNDPFKQWNDAKASEAFAAAYKNYKDKKLEKYGFSSTLFDFFHANPTINCENPTDVGCSAGTECGQGDWPNARVSAPAG
jgi:hypothetical protein